MTNQTSGGEERFCSIGSTGMVAGSQHLAVRAGAEILRAGGNAVDAALAMAACLTVVEPTANGIGGDLFAQVWYRGTLYGLNASGPAPRLLTLAEAQRQGWSAMPETGWGAVTVPGQPAGWAALAARFGTMPLAKVLQPAIAYAAEGFILSPTVAAEWAGAVQRFSGQAEPLVQTWFAAFAPAGRAPAAGTRLRFPQLADTLTELARTDCRSFYQGRLAATIVEYARQTGGFLGAEDLADYGPEWVEPVGVPFGDMEVWELPPNGQGLVVLQALRIFALRKPDPRDEIHFLHEQIEALKLAFADAALWLADPRFSGEGWQELLDEEYLKRRQALIGPEALQPMAGDPHSGGTVYLAAADREGNMVSLIQSNFNGFGSGIVVPGTGIALHNRGCQFSLAPGHPNCLAPGKRPYHTIIPGFLTRNGQGVGPFGVMGAYMQPQGQLQVLVRTLLLGEDPQSALDAPRWQWVGKRTVQVEPDFPVGWIEGLRRRGHQVEIMSDRRAFGKGQIIFRTPDGYQGGSDRRADGCAIGVCR